MKRFCRPTLGALLALLAQASCADTSENQDADLTSLTAVARTVSFEGYVYVPPGSSDATAHVYVEMQTRSAVGAFENIGISVNNRLFSEVDPATFARSTVTVVDTEHPEQPRRQLERIQYRFRDTVLLPASMATQSAPIPTALLMQWGAGRRRALASCTANDEHAQAYPIWYVFDPTRRTCVEDWRHEDASIASAAEHLGEGEISALEASRYYVPITLRIEDESTNYGTSYPEYDRLFSGGVERGKLVIALLNGPNESSTPVADDSGYREWLIELTEAMAGRPYRLVSESDPFARFQINGSPVTFQQFAAWELNGHFPAELNDSDVAALRQAVSTGFHHQWLTFETPVVVTSNGARRDFAIQIRSYLGAEFDTDPYREAIAHADVVIYNGHSYIGNGPLDPSHYTSSSLPNSYQLFFFDSCLSYNYYERGFLNLKYGGSQNLDMITNGLESPFWRSGSAIGRFVAELTSGRQPSYKRLLEAAQATDRLRVVDGETDNTYSPENAPIQLDY